MRWFALFLALIFVDYSAAAESEAWWVICDSCESDTDFRLAAYQAPLDGVVLVTNSDTGISRKFDRLTVIVDLPGEIVVSVNISDLTMPSTLEHVLSAAFEGANTIYIVVDRGNFSAPPGPGGSSASSVVDDLQFGRVIADFRHGVYSYLLHRGMFPTPQSVGIQGSVTIRGLSLGGSVANALRTRPIRVEVRYLDGSRLALTMSPDGMSISEVSIYDADGNELPSSVNASNRIELDRDGFQGREFEFGHAPMAFMDWLNHGGSGSGGGLSCRVEWTDGGVAVICRQP